MLPLKADYHYSSPPTTITGRHEQPFSFLEINMNTTHQLTVAIEHDGQSYTEFNFRPIQFGDVEALYGAANEMAAMRIVLSRLAGVPEGVIQKLDLQDVGNLLEVAAEAITRIAGKK
jgi:hypothetical protein